MAPPWLVEQPAVHQLRRQLARGRVVPFVGAGLSMALGFPGWTGFVDVLRRRTEAADAPIRRANVQGGAPHDPLLAVDYLRALLGDEAYHRAIAETFALDGARLAALGNSEVHRALGGLGCILWLTTNYDLALEHALKPAGGRVDSFGWSDEDEVNRFILGRSERRKRPAVVHLHGTVTAPNGIVLTETDYQRRYWWEAGDRFRLAALLSTRSALLLGTSLTDEDFKSVLREVRARLRQRWGQHFWVRGLPIALGDWAERAEDRRRETVFWREKFGVEVIHYPAPGDDHAELATALRAIAPGTEVPAPVGPSPPSKDDPNRGKFGGSPAREGHELRAAFRTVDAARGWVRVSLTVAGPEGARGQVRWWLHPTFDPAAERESPLRNGRAALTFVAWGAFTVGVQVEREGHAPVLLELDLATHPRAPTGFRDR
jgi:hypothetical protein